MKIFFISEYPPSFLEKGTPRGVYFLSISFQVKRFKALSKPTKPIFQLRRLTMKIRQHFLPVLILLVAAGCSSDAMEACMKQGMDRKLDGADRGAYVKARDQVRTECERKLKK